MNSSIVLLNLLRIALGNSTEWKVVWYDEDQKTMGKSLETSTGVQRNSSCFFLEFCGLSIDALILPSEAELAYSVRTYICAA